MLGPASLGIKLDKNIDFTLKKKRKKVTFPNFIASAPPQKWGCLFILKGTEMFSREVENSDC